jgi:hypothetical protein
MDAKALKRRRDYLLGRGGRKKKILWTQKI